MMIFTSPSLLLSSMFSSFSPKSGLAMTLKIFELAVWICGLYCDANISLLSFLDFIGLSEVYP